MAVSEQTPLKEYVANGVTRVFPLGFDCENKDHLIVTIDGEEVSSSTWSLANKEVTFLTAPLLNKNITFQRNTPYSRDRNYQTYDNSFRPEPVNKDFDWIWFKLQELGVADWILGNRITALKNYVDDQDDKLQLNINNLKSYVDEQDNELRSYLMDEIRKQGVALDQLDDYYNYLMQRLAQIAVDRGWSADFVVTADGSNQQQVNDRVGNTWREKTLGYNQNDRVMLDNGDIVKSITPNNTKNPNIDMTGWVAADSISNGIAYTDRFKQNPTILDFFTASEITEFTLNPTMDVTVIIKRAFATGIKKLNCLNLKMHITKQLLIEDPLATFTSGDVELYGNGAAFIDDTVYTDVSNPSFNSLFILDGGVNSFKSNIDYIGKQLASIGTKIGYIGATYVYSKRVNKNITVNVYFENLRYGILCGNYADPLLGGTVGVRGHLRCKNVGYPIASYLADDIELEITGDGFHRVHYIAGCNHARIKTQTKNYYIAPIANYYTDAKTGEGTSKGCTDCETEAIDQGSTQYVTNGYLMGFGLSRVDPNTLFDGITLNGHIRAKNGIAEKLGLATVVSSVRTVQPSYPTNWSNDIELNNINIKGIIDRRAQTADEHGFSDLYLSCVDDLSIPGELHFPKIKNLNIDVDYFAGSGNKPRGFWWFLNGLQDVAKVRLNARSSGLNVIKSNPNSLIKFKDSAIIGVDTGNSVSLNSKMEFIDSDIYGGNAYLPPTNKRFSNTKVGSSYPDTGVLIKTLTNELTLTGASATWANALPIHALILGVTFVITQEIVGSSGLLIGDGVTVGKFVSSPFTALGLGIGLSNTPVNTFPYITPGTRNIVVTARDSGGGTAATFTGGKVKIVVNFIEIPVPS